MKRSCVLPSYTRGNRDSRKFNILPEDAWLVRIYPGRGVWLTWYPEPVPPSLYLLLARKLLYAFRHWFLFRWKVILFNLKIHLFF